MIVGGAMTGEFGGAAVNDATTVLRAFSCILRICHIKLQGLELCAIVIIIIIVNNN